MLSKRLNDFIFIGIILLVIAGIVGMRTIVLGTMDTRIEEAEASNQELMSSIDSLQNLIAQHDGEEVLPLSILYQRAPSYYSRNRLRYTMYSQLELLGISDTEDRDLVINITENPSFLQGTDFHTLSQNLDAKRVYVSFETDDINDVYMVVEGIQSMQQRFLLQHISYTHFEEGESRLIHIDFVTFYNVTETEDAEE